MLMHALAASFEELRVRTGNPPLRGQVTVNMSEALKLQNVASFICQFYMSCLKPATKFCLRALPTYILLGGGGLGRLKNFGTINLTCN